MYGIIINERIQLWKIGCVCLINRAINKEYFDIRMPFVDKLKNKSLMKINCIKLIDKKWFDTLVLRNKYIARWKRTVDKHA